MTTDDATSESNGGDAAVSDADRPADLDAIITGALTVLDRAEPQDLYLPVLAPSDQERVDAFAKRGRAEATLQSYNTVRPHSSLGYRPPAPEAATPPLPASGSASLHLRPAMAAEVTMHQQSNRTTPWGLLRRLRRQRVHVAPS